jgi:histidine ammonia-lyase
VPNAIALTGDDLSIDQFEAVARGAGRVELAPEAIERIRAANEAIPRVLARGDSVYGLTTGVGAHKKYRVADAERDEFNRLLLPSHRVGQGPEAPADVVRGTMLKLLNQLCKGTSGVRTEIAERLVEALNGGHVPRVRMLGTVGESDLAPMADLAQEVLGDLQPTGKETLSLINTSAFATALAALAVIDCRRLSVAFEAAAALDLEAFAANLTPLHPRAAEVRPFAGVVEAREHLTGLLERSGLWETGARNLQDPLTFRCSVTVAGALRDALTHVEQLLAVELNASQENPIYIAAEDRFVSVANTDPASSAAAVDYLRIALAPSVTSACERTQKLLQSVWSGLSLGLIAEEGTPDDGLSEFGVASVAIAGEARLLAQPVSHEVVSSSIAEGIEDRVTFLPLSGRRLAEMVSLGERVCAIELVVAAQALDLRRPDPLGEGTARLHAMVRELVPFTGTGQVPPQDLEPVCELVRSGRVR